MKTKTLLLVCLFMGIGLTQLSAQNGKNGSGIFKQDLALENNFGWTMPVYCDGVVVDQVTCPVLYVEVTYHYINGVESWSSNKITNLILTSITTGEVYKNEGFDHWSWIKGYCLTGLKLIGDKGHNITMRILTDVYTYEIIEVSSNCH